MSEGGHCGSKPKRIAIGVAPLGTISIGIVPMGVICIGVVPMGVVSIGVVAMGVINACLLYTSPSPRDYAASRMPSSA